MLGHPRMLIVNSYNTLVNSASTSDFYIKLPAWYDQYDTIAVQNIQIPKTYYGISSGSNSFTITENGTPRTITLTVGNYNFTSLATELKTQLGLTYTVTPNASRGTYTIGNSSAITTTTYTFTDQRLSHTLGMDFPSSTFSGLSYETDIILYNTPSILVHSDIANNVSYSGTNNLMDDTILAIPVGNIGDLSYLSWTNNDVANINYANSLKNTIRFYLTDIYNQSLNLNEMPVLITLIFYNKDDTNQLIRDAYRLDALTI